MPNYAGSEAVIGRILVIDDDSATVDILSTQLSRDGHTVEQAYTGAEGLQLFEKGKFDVVLTDLRIGDMTGIEVLQAVRAEDSEVAVIILTGYASTESAVKAVKLGANDYLLKPLKLINLSQTVLNQIKSVGLSRRVHELNTAITEERDKLRRSVAELTLLKRLAGQMASVTSFMEGFEVILNLLVDEVDADIALIYDLGKGSTKVASRQLISESEGDSLTEIINRRTNSELDLDIQCSLKDYTVDGSLSVEVEDSQIESVIIVPLKLDSKTFGILAAASKHDGNYEHELAEFVSKLASDVSEFLSRVRRSVERQRHFTASVVEHTLDGIIVIDSSSGETMLNPVAQSMLGITANGIRPAEIAEILGIDLDAMISELAEEIQNGDSSHFLSCEAEVEREDKKSFYGLTISQLPGENGDATNILLVIHDVTKERSVEVMKNHLISNITHEVRTPTGVIKEFISLLLDGMGGDLTDTQVQYMKIMQSNIERLGRLIENLLTFAKADTGGFKVVLQPLELPIVLKEVVESMEVKLNRKRIKLESNLPADLPTVYADRDAVTQILTNLVDNAFKYSPEDTVITISVVVQGKKVDIQVSDQGYGINAKEQENIFKRFHRLVDADDPRFQEGVGLGLSLVKELVARQGGDIWLDSKEGEGSDFYFSLQIASEEMG